MVRCGVWNCLTSTRVSTVARGRLLSDGLPGYISIGMTLVSRNIVVVVVNGAHSLLNMM